VLIKDAIRALEKLRDVINATGNSSDDVEVEFHSQGGQLLKFEAEWQSGTSNVRYVFEAPPKTRD